MRLVMLAVLAWAACGGHGTTRLDARTDPAVCTANLEAEIDRSCAAPNDCVLVDHGDCCGTIKLAVRRGTEAAFPAVETTYQTCLACPATGCAHADQAEDGRIPGTAGQAIVAICPANRCTSTVQ